MRRPLRFLHVSTFYPPYSFGGDAMYIYRLAHLLGDQGHHVDVVHCVDSYHFLHPGEPEIEFPEHPLVHRHELRSRSGWLSPLLTHQTGKPIFKRRTIQELMDQNNYDVVQYHNISLLGPDVLRIETDSSHAIKLYMTHEHWLVCPTHVLWKFNRRPCESPQCLPCILLAKRPPQIWRYTGKLEAASRHVDQFVSPSKFTADMHEERGFSQPVAHLPYFIERADDDWKRPGPPPHQKPYFLFVGRLEVIKGLQTLIKVWEKIDSADLLIAGTGTHEDELRRLADGNGQIKFLGAKSQSELGNLYYHALACIVPSITYETFGIIIVEAFARKTPVIVRDLGALPEVVRESGGGFVFNTEDELIDAINRLAGSPERRKELGEKGYLAFEEKWSPAAHLDLYFSFLREIAFEKHGRVPWE